MSPVNAASTTPSPTKEKSFESFAKKTKSVEVLLTVLLSCKRPDAFGLDNSLVDWDLVCRRLDFKNVRTATTRWGQVKKELLECAGAMKITCTPNKSGGKENDLDDASPPETPSKVYRITKPSTTAKKRGEGVKKQTPGRGGRKSALSKSKQVALEQELGLVSEEDREQSTDVNE
ncbi:hypothetical protein TWF694_003988 [Orbilia ellipsospora]|uniref:Uncharacterized protein n=1 Tax=Orbilia ellipsospora TaxID=2528407 RepID=A0AAV9WY28_9PEZI